MRAMKPFWRRKADGTLRYRPAAESMPKQRSSRANGRVVVSGSAARGRHLRELLADFGRGLEPLHILREGSSCSRRRKCVVRARGQAIVVLGY
jgi:hypothetical protein